MFGLSSSLAILVSVLLVQLSSAQAATYSSVSLTEADSTYSVAIETFDLGYQATEVGDVNGDGYMDLWMTGVDISDYTDQAYLVYGQAGGYSGNVNLATNSNVAKFVGVTGDGGDSGSDPTVARLGDIDQDGYDDFMVGIYYASSRAGAAYLIYGRSAQYSGTNSLSLVGVQFLGEAAADYAGSSVAGVGDINADGYDDAVIGAYWNDSKKGAAYIVYGSSTRYTNRNLATLPKFTGAAINQYAGGTVSAAQDVNNDGYDDFLVAAQGYDSYTGTVYLVYGRSAAYSGTTALSGLPQFSGSEVGDGVGASLAALGDLNGDGYDDVAIGTNQQIAGVNAIGAYLIYGQAASYSGSQTTSTLPSFTVEGSETVVNVGAAGDQNNDGYQDLLIGVPETSSAGAGYLILGQATSYSGATGLASAEARIVGLHTNDQIGSVVGSTHLFDNTFPQVIIGAPGEDSAADSAGMVYLLTLYTDGDGDGMPGTAGLVAGDDCNDSDATLTSELTYYQDVDGDGFGDSTSTTSSCSLTAPAGYVDNATDTDDSTLGMIADVTVDDATVTVTYDSGFTETTSPFSGSGKVLAAVSQDQLRWIATNGKVIKLYSEGELVAHKKVYNKKANSVAKGKLRLSNFYDGYETIVYLNARGKHGRLAVLRLTEANLLNKLKTTSIQLDRRPSKQRVTLSTSKHRITGHWDRGAHLVTAKWKVKSSGKLQSL